MNASDPTQALFRNVFGLGAAQGTYTVRKFNRWGSLIIGVILAGAGFLLMAGGAVYSYYQIDRLGPAVQERMVSTILLPLSCIGLVMIAIGLLSVWSAFNNWNKAAVVYRDGFAYSDRKGMRQFRWTDIQSMTSAVTKNYTNGVYTGTTHLYTLIDRNGQKIVLNDSLQQVEDLAEKVQQGIFPHLYQAAADQYNAGRPVVFGSVAISKQGITIGKKEYGWDDVQQVSIQQGVLSVAKKGGGWFTGATAAASTLPNLPVLLSMVNQIKGLNTPQQ